MSKIRRRHAAAYTVPHATRGARRGASRKRFEGSCDLRRRGRWRGTVNEPSETAHDTAGHTKATTLRCGHPSSLIRSRGRWDQTVGQGMLTVATRATGDHAPIVLLRKNTLSSTVVA